MTNPCEWLDRISSLGYALLLDSCGSLPGSNGRFDIITAAPELVTTVRDGKTYILDTAKGVETESDQSPFAALDTQLHGITPLEYHDLPFTGGLAGYWGYELNNLLEPTKVPPRRHSAPDMIVGLYLWGIVTDHEKKTTQLFFHNDIARAKIEQILKVLEAQVEPTESPSFSLEQPFAPDISRKRYNHSFEQIQEWIQSGDCYQVNLTQRFSATYLGEPLTAYKKLRELSPTPFSAYLDYPEVKILSHSPERLLKSEQGHIETKPIKGTRPRGKTEDEDQVFADELLNSPKDRAENLMIVDLLRNDLGRNCQPGSISVPILFGLESYANVHHMVSTITGQLGDDRTNIDLLRDAFPGGSVTGAPKIRSMEIIRELEPEARAVYCGSIGYISCDGTMDTNIPIRSLMADGENIHTWGGGAIVADSDCDSEYEESLTKIRNLVKGLESNFHN
nr:aminodeoxychorismate synthase component I [Sansalvadorimonas sp. 2012CJ34-2]